MKQSMALLPHVEESDKEIQFLHTSLYYVERYLPVYARRQKEMDCFLASE